MRELWIGDTNFYRVGYGFWGSAWEWIKDLTLCTFGRHDILDDSCARCGSVVRLNTGKKPIYPQWEMAVGEFELPPPSP